jgi:hypothetical protein
MMGCVVQMDGWLVTATCDEAKSNLEGCGEKIHIMARGWGSRGSMSATGGAIQTEKITVTSNWGKFPLGILEPIQTLTNGWILWSESDSLCVLSSFVPLKSSSGLRNNRTPLVSDRSQTLRSFLPCCQKFQEVMEIFETISISNDVNHCCG